MSKQGIRSVSYEFPFDVHVLLLYQQLKQKLTIAYKKLFTFRGPLYMAFSYEENQGPQHRPLAQKIMDISYYLNGTTVTLSRMVRNKTVVVVVVVVVVVFKVPINERKRLTGRIAPPQGGH